MTESIRQKYEIVIGLEIHAQLQTQSKIFAADSASFGGQPNTHISPITLGHPGTLPKLNRKAVEYATRMGLACGSHISDYQYFDRKNYFYPDLPKGYQVTQDKTPICIGGGLAIKYKSALGEATDGFVKFHHIHLEEDAGKSVHAEAETDTLLDYNRAGVPLIEMVTEPEIKSAEEATAFLGEIRRLVRYLDICDGNMEEGSLRCDVNISVMPVGSKVFGTKVEIKNMNSMKFIQKAIEFETIRQINAVENSQKIIQETRMFDPENGQTYSMREKESMNDYRYFPEPDLAPIRLSGEFLGSIKAQMPALPWELFEKFTQTYNLPEYDANVLTDTKETALFFEEICKHTQNYKAASNWTMGRILGYLNESGKEISDFEIVPSKVAALINLIDEGKVSNSVASQQIFGAMLQNPRQEPLAIAQANGWIQQSDSLALESIINEVLEANPAQVKAYKFDGKKNLLGMFMGQVMKKTNNSADPKITTELIRKILDS
jgi:aspartyl-tRNA(Asn)/glutamyl-tRNA(Gln) amidotransferase subunit B